MKKSLLDTIMEQIDLSNVIIKHSSTFLTSDPTVKIVPDDLAILIGVDQTMMLCQIDFWVQNHHDDEHCKDGRYWIYETYDDWVEQFPYWGKTKIRDILRKLKEKNLIITGNYNKMSGDNTKWYTVNYDLLDKIMSEKKRLDDTHLSESDTCPLSESDTCHLSENGRPIPNISIPNKSLPKKSKKEWSDFDKSKHRSPDSGLKIRLHYLYGHYDSDVSKLEDVIRYFFDKYEVLKGERHEYIVLDDYFYEPTMLIGTVAYELDYANMTDIVDQYFNDFPDTVWDYRHFGTEKILRTRMYELGYGQADVDGILGKETYTPNNSNDVGSEWGL